MGMSIQTGVSEKLGGGVRKRTEGGKEQVSDS